jgi:cation transport regulator ChaB
MPPELVEQARTIRRILFLAVGALAFLGALGAAWYAESHLKDVSAAEFELVQAQNDKLRSKESALKVAQSAVKTEQETCDRFQQLLQQRMETLHRMAAVRESLKQIDGMWLTAWEPLKPANNYRDDDSRDKDVPPPAAAKITVRGWKDAMTKAEDAWAKLNNGQRKTANVIVMDSLRKNSILFSKVEPENMRELKGCLMEYTIKITFAPTPSIIAPAGKGKEAGK